MDTAIQNLMDKEAIQSLIYTYCRAVDRIDAELGYSIWHEDGQADYGASYFQGTGRGLIDQICENHRNLISHSHQVSNILINLDGDHATSEAYMTGTMRSQRGEAIMQISVWVRYIDKWEKRNGCWGLVHRTAVYDHNDIREVTPLGRPSNATRDYSDPSYAALPPLNR